MSILQADVIVVGAGSAGSAVAGRVSEDPRLRVLLIESGGHTDRFLLNQPGLSLLKGIGDPRFDWNLRAEPDPTRKGKSSHVYRGKGLGGSSAINGMVYFRGDRTDYDHWGQLGNRGWSWDDVLPAFKRMEQGRHHDPDSFGQDGPLHVEPPRSVHPLTQAFVESGLSLGIPANPGLAAPDVHGIGLADGTQHQGSRWSAARAYLYPVLGKRPNLEVMLNTDVVRILIEEGRATGVVVRRGDRDEVVRAREIILSAGAVHSPAILMRSGIGDAATLADFGIASTSHLPGVGQNLQDHVETALVYRVAQRTTNQETNLIWQAIRGLQWLLTRRGPAASAGADALAMVKSRPGLEAADILLYFGAYIAGLSEEGVEFAEDSGVTVDVGLMHPRVRGAITLRSAEVREQPKIHYRLLADPEDVADILRGIRIAQDLVAQPPLARLITGPYAPTTMRPSDAELKDYVAEVARPSLHLCGTCRMGPDDDMSVVDARLRVRTIAGLRVADASIIPAIPSCNLNAPSIMIGERAAAFVREELAA